MIYTAAKKKLFLLCTQSWQSRIFPAAWKESTKIPILKSKNNAQMLQSPYLQDFFSYFMQVYNSMTAQVLLAFL